MRKSCCIEEGGICSESSSSMILRSACSHKHSPISKTVEGANVRESTPKPRKRNDETSQVIIKSSGHNNLHISSILGTSLKELTFKSVEESYSHSKEVYSNLESSREDSFTFYDVSSLNSTCAKDQNYHRISSSCDSHLNGSLLRKEKCSDYSSGTESDLSKSVSNDISWKMSRGQRTTRSSSSRRTISETDSEEEFSVQKNLLARSQRSDLNSNSKLVSTSYGLFNRGTHNHNNLSLSSQALSRSNLTLSSNNMHEHSEGSLENNRRSYFSESPQLNVSDVHYSYFDRARWFIWKCIYLKIIKNINFDVWCLSRLHNYGKSKAIFMLLLPLLLFVIWGSMQEEWQACLGSSTGAVSGLHSIANFASFLPSLPSYSSHQEEGISSQNSRSSPEATPESPYLFSAVYSLFSGLLYKSSENTTSDYEHSEYLTVGKENREEIRLLAVEILKEETQNLLENFKASLSHLPRNDEKEENEEKFKMQMDDLQQEIKDFKQKIGKLDESIKLNMQRMTKVETTNEFASDLQENVDSINAKLKILEEKIEAIGEVKKCCDEKLNLASIEISLIAALKKIIKSESEDNSTYQFLYDWLNSKFVNQEAVSEEIKLALQQLKAEQKASRPNFEKIIENLVLRHVEAMKANLTSTVTAAQDFSSERISSNIFSEDSVHKMVKEALLIYDADKTGKADYALESGGGSIIGTRCSEAYVEKSGKFSIFGLPLWSLSSSPRTVIQPGMQPGQCWAFKGSQGFLVLELSSVIYPSGFTLEHIPISLSPTESIDSAPKEFSVWGLLSEEDNSGKLLGKYLYDIKGDPLQYFPIQNFIGEPFQYLELKIHNNHGNMDYTCLYRFRVHGKRAR